MSQPVFNFDKLPRDLLPAELLLAQRLREGVVCGFGTGGRPEKPDIGVNVIRSHVLRFFVLGGKEDLGFPVWGANIQLWGAWIEGESVPLRPHKVVSMADVSTSRSLLFGRCHFAAPLDMPGAECAALRLDGSLLSGGFEGSGLKTKGIVSLRDMTVNGEVNLASSRIGGDLLCAGSKFNNEGGNALVASDAVIDGSIGMCTNNSTSGAKRFSAVGQVCLFNVRIGGGLICYGGEFKNSDKYALIAARVQIGSDVQMNEGFSATGTVSLQSAQIGGNLACRNGTFSNPGKIALVAQDATVNGSVLLRDGFIADGEVDFLGVRIKSHLDCTGGEFHDGVSAVCAEMAVLQWHDVKGQGIVDLKSAKTSILVDEMDAWKPFRLDMIGFSYDHLFNHANAQSRIEWLANRPEETPFAPLPYEQAAKVLFGMGHDADAREILLEKERLQTADKRTPLLRKIGRKLWDVFAGYGYRLRYTAAWMVFFVIFGWGLFDFADDNGRMVPHQPVVVADADYKAAASPACAEFKCPPERRPTAIVARMFPDYPEFNAFIYSVDVFIPFFALHQEPYWYPKPVDADRDIALWILPLWYWLEIGFGWILTSLFLLSVTGVLRPRQSSGEKG